MPSFFCLPESDSEWLNASTFFPLTSPWYSKSNERVRVNSSEYSCWKYHLALTLENWQIFRAILYCS